MRLTFTRYGGAPFVFDVFLHGNYPFEPPVVHFHSHTNGKGRCNRGYLVDLYEMCSDGVSQSI